MLHLTKVGQGPNLVLLHGWGSSSKVWQTLIKPLSRKFCVWCVDLPGHGESHSVNWDCSTKQGVELLAQYLPQTCSIVGWSLGGLLAQLYVNQIPHRVENLMLIGSTPKFTADISWSHGMQQDVFAAFCDQYTNFPEQTLQKFCALQVVDTDLSKHVLSILQNALSNQHHHIKNIFWGLQWLQNIDLRDQPILCKVPIKLLHGDKDKVSSCFAAQQTTTIWKNTRLEKIANAGHAPFISHPESFLKLIEAWL